MELYSVDSDDFGGSLEELARETAPECFADNISIKDCKHKHYIDTETSRPIKSHGRPLTPPEHQLIEQFVEEGLDQGIIEKTDSPWSSPLLLVKKQDGSTRVCVDYRALNKVTRKNAYPLPKIDETYQFLSGSKVFSTVDLKSGFWQTQMADEDKEKTAFTCRQGHFQWRVMPFGLCNAPATFQEMMNDILKYIIDKFALVYLDNVIIYPKSEEEHKAHIKTLFDILKKDGLVVSEKKCQCGRSSLLFLGHIMDGDGIKTNPEKISKIVEWPTPENISHVRGFLNLCTYYKRFITKFSTIASPLYKLTEGSPKPGTSIKWGREEEASFIGLKKALSETIICKHPVPY